MDPNDLCAICDTAFNNEEVVKLSNTIRRSLENASSKMGDRLLMKLRGKDYLHKKCYIHYTHYKNIGRVQRVNASLNINEETPSTSKQSSKFNFNTNCIFCSRNASDEFIASECKKPKNKRAKVCKVTDQGRLQNLLKKEIDRGNEASELFNLLKSVDLSINIPRYHEQCHIDYCKNYQKRNRSKQSSKIITFIMDYLKSHEDESQFSLNEILSSYEGSTYGVRYVEELLEKIYGDQILITRVRGKDTIISFRDKVVNLAGDYSHTSREKNEIDERQRIVKAAAEIIREDIQSKVYETDAYPLPNNFFSEAEVDVPDTLKTMLDTIILKRKERGIDKWKLRSTAIAHSIIAAFCIDDVSGSSENVERPQKKTKYV